ncbi:MAG: hypothetical protein R3D29_00425 [Nitratireductor sp.]
MANARAACDADNCPVMSRAPIRNFCSAAKMRAASSLLSWSGERERPGQGVTAR